MYRHDAYLLLKKNFQNIVNVMIITKVVKDVYTLKSRARENCMMHFPQNSLSVFYKCYPCLYNIHVQ